MKTPFEYRKEFLQGLIIYTFYPMLQSMFFISINQPHSFFQFFCGFQMPPPMLLNHTMDAIP